MDYRSERETVMKGELIFLVVWEGDSDKGVMDNGTGRGTLMKGEWIFMGLGGRQK